MRKRAYFDKYWGLGWPSLEALQPYFIAPAGKEWFYSGGNDGASLELIGVQDTEHLPLGGGRIDIRLDMWGHPDLGLLLIYSKRGGGYREVLNSKGDLTKVKDRVWTLHNDPMPVGLYVSFDKAWLAVKEFIESEGQLPKSIEWISNKELPEGTFPDS